MISAPSITVRCDQRRDGKPCLVGKPFALPSFATDREAATRLFKATWTDWLVTVTGEVYCPQCRVVAQNAVLAAKAAREAR